MKLFEKAQFVLACALFIIAGVMFFSQVTKTASLFVGGLFLILWALMGGLVRLAWEEVKPKKEEVKQQ